MKVHIFAILCVVASCCLATQTLDEYELGLLKRLEDTLKARQRQQHHVINNVRDGPISQSYVRPKIAGVKRTHTKDWSSYFEAGDNMQQVTDKPMHPLLRNWFTADDGSFRATNTTSTAVPSTIPPSPNPTTTQATTTTRVPTFKFPSWWPSWMRLRRRLRLREEQLS